MPPTPLSIAKERIDEAYRSSANVLDLIGIGLRTLPESLGKLKNVRTLQLAYNHLDTLPEIVRTLKGLQELDLSANNLTELPSWIGDFRQLTTLRVSSNQIKELPDALGKLHQLQRFHAADNQLSTLPKSLWKLSELRSLILSDNQLPFIPKDIGDLKQLKIFDISGNRLDHLPAELGALAELEQLNAGQNELVSIPKSLSQLARLAILDLSSNRLWKLPDWLKEQNSLNRLMLHNNPELKLPTEILGPEPREAPFSERHVEAKRILDYYFAARGDYQELNEARLILVGRGNSGKTSIVKRMVFDTFLREEPCTEGIEIKRWQPFPDLNDVWLNIWDFGGQEVMHATHQFFMTGNCLYLLVINGREGLADHDVIYWMKLIESFADDSPVIVVQNKILEMDFDLSYQDLKKNYPQIVGFQKTDCSNGDGIGKLADWIRQAIGEKMPFMHAKFPSRWFEIKNELAQMKGDYLSYEAFRRLCRKHGQDNPEQQDNLAHMLHCLGVALNFRDDPRLRENCVLNPHWVTEGVYSVLMHPQLSAKHGELHIDDLSVWLEPIRYPRDKHPFLLELMRKFRLCFAFLDEENHYLVPELLEKVQPDLGDCFDPKRCLNFEYHYSVLPEGLLPQFIVRTHALSEANPAVRWRTGVVIAWGGAKALVQADPVKQRVVVRVEVFSQNSAIQLLAIVRADFERIHRQIRSLDVVEMVPLPEYPEVALKYADLLVYERNNIAEIPVVVGNDMIKTRVSDLLNGVDYGGAKGRFLRKQSREKRWRLFISYAKEDEKFKKELELHLKLLEQAGTLSVWSDRCILPGEERDREIDRNLEVADIILLLVSAAFINSNYCDGNEVAKAMARHKSGAAKVIPVILRPCLWKQTSFKELKALPEEERPVKKWPQRAEAWINVVQGIEKVIEILDTKSGW